MAVATFCEEEDEVVCIEPYFDAYRKAAEVVPSSEGEVNEALPPPEEQQQEEQPASSCCCCCPTSCCCCCPPGICRPKAAPTSTDSA